MLSGVSVVSVSGECGVVSVRVSGMSVSSECGVVSVEW